MEKDSRIILHVDLDAFFAAAEVLANPALRGLPVVVGGRPGDRAAVATASYEARALGIRTGMSISEAARIAPHAVYLPCNPPHYFDLSARMIRLLLRRTSLVEPASIDEAFLDTAGLTHNLEEGETLARSIQEEIQRSLGLTSSVGIAPNKRIAKAASSERKPGGRTILDVDSFRSRFSGRSVTALDGVGEAVATRLAGAGILTIGELASAPASFLRRILGGRGPQLGEAARGEDSTPVVPVGSARDPRSLGHEYTLHHRDMNRESIRRVILSLSEDVAWDLRNEGWIADTIRLTIRGEDRVARFRQCSIREGITSNLVIFRTALRMFNGLDDVGIIRMIGVSVSGLMRVAPKNGEAVRSGELLPSVRDGSFYETVDSLRSIYGRGILRRASILRDSMRRPHR